VLEQPHEIVAQGNREAAELGNAIKALGAFAEYRSVYKREFFTSEFKLQLLEDKCKHYEQNIQGLIKFLNLGDKRVVRRLKELGVAMPKEGSK
jgi:DNA-binding NtrC family response regulator